MGGAAAAAFLVALLEAHGVGAKVIEGGAPEAPPFVGLFMGDLGVLLPILLVVGGAVGVACLVLEPGAPKSPLEHLTKLGHAPPSVRHRRAALAPLLVFTTFAWTLASAH